MNSSSRPVDAEVHVEVLPRSSTPSGASFSLTSTFLRSLISGLRELLGMAAASMNTFWAAATPAPNGVS